MFETNDGLMTKEAQNKEALKKHPLYIETIFGEPNAWKLIDKTKNGDVVTIMLAKEIGFVGCFVQVQNQNAEGQVYSVNTMFSEKLRIQEMGNEGKLKRYDLVDIKSVDMNKSNVAL